MKKRTVSNSFSSESGLFAVLFERAYYHLLLNSESKGGGPQKWRALFYLDEDFLKTRIDAVLVQLVAVKGQALDELLHRALRFERKERQAERNVAPLARVLRQSEALAELFDDALRLFFLARCISGIGLGGGEEEEEEEEEDTFSMNVKM
jgi:hypothetical protein